MEDLRVGQLAQEYAQLAEQVAALTEQLKALQPAPEARRYPKESQLNDMSVDSIPAELHGQGSPNPPPQGAAPAEQTPYTWAAAPPSQAPPRRRDRAETPPRTQNAPPRRRGRAETPPRTQNAPPRQVLPLQPEQAAAAPAPRKSKVGAFIGNLLFYGVMLAMLVGVFVLRSGSGGAPVSFAGYTAQLVLTSSMEEVIPKGSLVISKQVDPSTLQIGDDITYLINQTTTITHRIIGITERYEDTGQRGFQTQGVMNDAPDKEIVPAVNIVGKVVFHSMALGQAANFVNNNWPLLIFLLVLLIVFIKVMQYILRKNPDGVDEAPQRQRKRVNRR